MNKYFMAYSEWLSSEEEANLMRQVIVSYDITYPPFRTQLRSDLDKTYSFNPVDESTLLLVRSLNKEQIKTLIKDIRVMYKLYQTKINESAAEERRVAVHLILPNGLLFHKEMVIEEIVQE